MITVLTTMVAAGCSSNPPAHLGVKNGKLTQCPDSPNCISSQSEDPDHRMDALKFRGDHRGTMSAILRIVENTVRTTIVTNRDDYLHVEYRTRLGFVDDVEFYLDRESRTVHFRSASRVGYSDLGVNRKRMEEFTNSYLGL